MQREKRKNGFESMGMGQNRKKNIREIDADVDAETDFH